MIENILSFAEQFTRMDIDGTVIHCPYWMNKIVDGQVKLRGFLEGKGTPDEIHQELVKRLHQQFPNQTVHLTVQFIQKFAKRERIGIDCSGFVFQVLDKLVKLKYNNCRVNSLSQIFKSGIRRTNADTLTGREFCLPVKNVSCMKPGDIVRMMGGKHIAVLLNITNLFITYVHSARTAKIQGAHLGKIKIINNDISLDQQEWLEQTIRNENYGRRHFKPERGDGVFRLKIFT